METTPHNNNQAMKLKGNNNPFNNTRNLTNFGEIVEKNLNFHCNFSECSQF